MVRWNVLVAFVLVFVSGPAAFKALEVATVAAVPASGEHFDGGLVQIEFLAPFFASGQAPTPEDERACYWASFDEDLPNPEEGQPTSDADACTSRQESRQVVFLRAPDARGTLAIHWREATVKVPYSVVAGTSVSMWAGVEGGELHVGIVPGATLKPFFETKEIVWSALAGATFLLAAAALAWNARPRWFTPAASICLAGLLILKGDDDWTPPTVSVWSVIIMVGAYIWLRWSTQWSQRGTRPIVTPPSGPDLGADLPRLDAIGLREDLR